MKGKILTKVSKLSFAAMLASSIFLITADTAMADRGGTVGLIWLEK